MGAEMGLEYIIRLVGGLAFTFALLIGGALVVRKFGLFGVKPDGAVRRLRMVDAVSIDAKHRVVLVRHDDEEHLILIGERDTLLSTRPAKPEPAPEVKI